MPLTLYLALGALNRPLDRYDHPFMLSLSRIPDVIPLAGVEVDVWMSSPVGLYETQADMNLRGKFATDAEGRFSFHSVKPGPYPVAPDVKGPWFTFAYTFVMEPGDALLPNPPIK